MEVNRTSFPGVCGLMDTSRVNIPTAIQIWTDSQDRWSWVTDSITLKCRNVCQRIAGLPKMVVSHSSAWRIKIDFTVFFLTSSVRVNTAKSVLRGHQFWKASYSLADVPAFQCNWTCHQKPSYFHSEWANLSTKVLLNQLDQPKRCFKIQQNMGIRDTQGTVKNCSEFWGDLVSQVHFYVLNRLRDWSSCP